MNLSFMSSENVPFLSPSSNFLPASQYPSLLLCFTRIFHKSLDTMYVQNKSEPMQNESSGSKLANISGFCFSIIFLASSIPHAFPPIIPLPTSLLYMAMQSSQSKYSLILSDIFLSLAIIMLHIMSHLSDMSTPLSCRSSVFVKNLSQLSVFCSFMLDELITL